VAAYSARTLSQPDSDRGEVIVLLVTGAAVLTALVPPRHLAFGDSNKAYSVPNWLTAFLPGNIAANARTSAQPGGLSRPL
jgi:hypothetical protein